MFPSRYFPGRYFPRRYFPALGGIIVPAVKWIAARFSRTGVVRENGATLAAALGPGCSTLAGGHRSTLTEE